MKRVFISYSHDSDEHRAKVQAYAEQLRREPGLVVVIDSDTGPGGPAEGWPQWSERQVIEADVVLATCTVRYCERYEGNQPYAEGRGAVCEARAIRQCVYDCAGVNHKIRVLLFDDADQQHIPTNLKPYHAFHAARDYAALVDWLTDKVPVAPAPLPAGAGVNWPLPDAAYVRPLADRREPFVLFEQAITGQTAQRILFFQGSSSTGKSVLLDAVLNYARRLGVAAAYFDFKGCPSLDDLFNSLKLDLGQIILPQACKASGTARFYELIADLQQIKTPLLLLLDTWEQASDEAQNWVETQLLPRIDKAPAVVVVLAGQRIPEPARRPWASMLASFALQPIQEVDEWLAYTCDYLRCSDIRRDQIETLTRATRGDPGQLSALLATLAQSTPTAAGSAA